MNWKQKGGRISKKKGRKVGKKDQPRHAAESGDNRTGRTHRFYQEVVVAEEVRSLLEKIAQGEYLDWQDVQRPLILGEGFDEYVRFLRDLTVKERGEFGAFILSGTSVDNWGRLYVRTQLKRGSFGAVKAVVPGRTILAKLGATIHGTGHTHRADPIYFHFGDPWTVAYDSSRVAKRLHGGNPLFQLIVTPAQAGILFATLQGRDYIDSHRPVQFERHRSEIRKEVCKVAQGMGWENRFSEQAGGLMNLTRRLLQTKWWGEIGMGVVMTGDIDAEFVVYQPLDTTGTTREFLERLFNQGLVSPFFRKYSGF